MAHFAKIDSDGFVVDVIVIDDSNAPDPAPENSEEQGRNFIASLTKNDERLEGTWVQTSYSGSFRKQYAGIGFFYDSNSDVFISPQPFLSWALDANYDWQPPTPMPDIEGVWVWNEDTLSWVDITTK